MKHRLLLQSTAVSQEKATPAYVGRIRAKRRRCRERRGEAERVALPGDVIAASVSSLSWTTELQAGLAGTWRPGMQGAAREALTRGKTRAAQRHTDSRAQRPRPGLC